MNRVRTWDVDLEQWAAQLLGEPFAWGVTDCATLAIKSQRILYGVDVFRLPTWKSKAKALRTLTDVTSIRAVLKAHARRVGRNFLQAGDLVLVGKGCAELETDGLMIVVRDYALATSPASGVTAVPLEAIPTTLTSYWRIDVG